MATKKCPECAEAVQREAKVCKHCGYRFDGPAEAARLEVEASKRNGSTGRFVVYLGIVLAVLWLAGGLSNDERGATNASTTASGLGQTNASAERARAAAAEAQEKVRRDRECREDVSCYGDNASMSAAFACQAPIERLARNSFEWTDGWLDGKLSRLAWNHKERGIVTYFGDKLKLQNGFGAWVIHTYKCVYDVPNKRVIEVDAWPGQLS